MVGFDGRFNLQSDYIMKGKRFRVIEREHGKSYGIDIKKR